MRKRPYDGVVFVALFIRVRTWMVHIHKVSSFLSDGECVNFIKNFSPIYIDT